MKNKEHKLYAYKRSKYVDDKILRNIVKKKNGSVYEYYLSICNQLKNRLPQNDYKKAKRKISIHIRNYVNMKKLQENSRSGNTDTETTAITVLSNIFKLNKSKTLKKLEMKNFCLYENAENTIENLKKVRYVKKNPRNIVLNDYSLNDISPYFILHRLREELKLDYSLYVSNDVVNLLNKMNIDIGHGKFLGTGINAEELERKTGSKPNYNKSKISKVKAFNLNDYEIKDDNISGKSGDKIEKISGNFTNTLSNWGIKVNLSCISEILNNCIVHSQDKKTLSMGWCVLERNLGKKEIQICIISYGYNSIGENIMEKYGEKYPYFNIPNSNLFTRENLATVLALQDGISSQNQTEDHKRGLGFMKVLDNIIVASDKNFDFNIISGKTQIIIKSTQENPFHIYGDTETGRTNYLNKDNNKNCIPDKNNVYLLNNRFPGTLISVRMYV